MKYILSFFCLLTPVSSFGMERRHIPGAFMFNIQTPRQQRPKTPIHDLNKQKVYIPTEQIDNKRKREEEKKKAKNQNRPCKRHKKVDAKKSATIMTLAKKETPVVIGNPHVNRYNKNKCFVCKADDIKSVFIDLFMYTLDPVSHQSSLHRAPKQLTDEKDIKITIPFIKQDNAIIYESYIMLSIHDALQQVKICLNDETPKGFFITYSYYKKYIYVMDTESNIIAAVPTTRTTITL